MKYHIIILSVIVSTLGHNLPTPQLSKCICPAVYQPVCGQSNGVFITFSNLCQFQCAQASNPDLAIFSQGACAKSVDDGPNQILRNGSPQKCMCSMEYRPVCGTDGKQYNNICHLNCERQNNPALGIASEGQCSPSQEGVSMIDPPAVGIKPVPYSNTEDVSCVCTREYRPVCSNQGTFPNQCEYKCAAKRIKGLYIISQGTCE